MRPSPNYPHHQHSTRSVSSGGGGAAARPVFDMPSNVEELEELIQDENVLQSSFENSDYAKQMLNVQQQLHDGNKAIAERMLSKKEMLFERREQVQKLQQELADLKKQFEDNSKLQSQLLKDYNGETILERLRMAIADSEACAEGVGTELMESKIDLDTFLKKYKEHRKMMHLRTSKLELVHANPQYLLNSR